ncbi:probable RNA helicase armi isoform X2 [Phymastichus coffea]|uniref:probable RNA helicase armi isoform X2 n=1 Tax=Phymastichus coffea TaxID=108790 RepID=UPI00273ACB7D|nr:probable RNA helicase armi isoform X2 [Phymastichus coffea]
MISLIEYVSNKLFNNENSCDNIVVPDKLEELLAKIDDAKQINEEIDEPQLNNIEDEEGCFYKTGTVTVLKQDYVLIDDDHICETKYVIPTDLKEGDQVYYMAYKKDKNDDLKVRKIIYKIESVWEDEEKPVHNIPKSDLNHELNNTEKKGMNKRIIVGKVNERKGREISLEDNTCINLDNVSAEFVPVIGDWVKLECLVEVNEDVPNFQGEILEIEEMKPLRSLQKLGKVTEYDEETSSGLIENTIVFVKTVCLAGYIPCIGDKVVVHCIESDQRIGKHWRALEVVPMEDVSTRYETSTVKHKPQLPADELDELIRDKESIEITNNIKITLDAKTEQEVTVTVKNNGNFKQIINRCSFLCKKSESQLTLLFPSDNEIQELKPSDSTTYRFKCKARFVGVSEELVIFKFKNFKIGRIFSITVNSINPNKVISPESSSAYANNNNQRSVIPRVFEDGMYIRGMKPYRTAKFITMRPTTWKIPEILWTAINKIIQERKTHSEAEFILADRVPCLYQHLNIDNYKQRFDYLLYLEEIAQILDMRRFDMATAVMHRSGEFLVLNVPGLAEKRPSLIIGDRVIVSFKWDETNGQKCYEGYIHKIKSSDVFLKFNQTFHESYHGEDCQVSFKGSTTVLQRCHTAIGMAMNRLGPDFLFPKKVVQKEPQFNFVEAEEDTTDIENNEAQNMQKIQEIHADTSLDNDERVKAVEAILSRKRIDWFTENLNVYQKLAVKNILKGVARPLPYVIFGPPGTGKTITVCESILQILFTMNDSRILVATPSNSSANLIAERLLKSKRLQPGDLVRLVAHHYLESDQIPENLIPYCATADIAAEGSRADVNLRDYRGYQKNVTLSVLCRSRIIVGTCSAIGILYNMGCKPGHFTHVIIDEAGQATEPEIMIPLILAHTSTTQIILAGDPKQLGPVNQSRLAGYFGLNDSFLVRLLQQFPYQRDPVGFETGYDPRLITKLLMNYRSLPELLDLPNKLFYEAELIPQVHETESAEAELLETLSDMLPKRLGTPLPIVFHAVDGKNMQDQDSPSWYNPEEATQVYIYLLDLYNRGLSPNDIGIITPYSKQVFRIKSLLAELDLEIPKVGSVEEFQGQERKVIILSTVRTAEDKIRDDIRHALGFVAARERLNVAITRARSLLIIVGNPNLLQQDVYWRSVLEYCKSRNAYVTNKIAK